MGTKLIPGGDAEFTVDSGSQAPHHIFLPDPADGHPGKQIVSGSPLANATTWQPAANEASLVRFVAHRDGALTSLRFVLDTASVLGDTGEFAVYDGTLEHKLGSTGVVDLDLDGTAGVKTATFTTPPFVTVGAIFYLAHSNSYGDAVFGGFGFTSNIDSEFFGATVPDLIFAKKAAAYPLPTSIASPVSVYAGVKAILGFS